MNLRTERGRPRPQPFRLVGRRGVSLERCSGSALLRPRTVAPRSGLFESIVAMRSRCRDAHREGFLGINLHVARILAKNHRFGNRIGP